MLRTITGFHADDLGDIVAELECGHGQHVRHRPPLFPNPWVLDAASRAGRVGTPLGCGRCARAEAPEDLAVARRLGPWDESGLPGALLAEHRTPHGGWARLVVLDGSCDFVLPAIGRTVENPTRLVAGMSHDIPPGATHAVVLNGPVRLALDLLAPPAGSTARGVTSPTAG